MFLDGFRGYVACCLNVVNVLTVASFFLFWKVVVVWLFPGGLDDLIFLLLLGNFEKWDSCY